MNKFEKIILKFGISFLIINSILIIALALIGYYIDFKGIG